MDSETPGAFWGRAHVPRVNDGRDGAQAARLDCLTEARAGFVIETTFGAVGATPACLEDAAGDAPIRLAALALQKPDAEAKADLYLAAIRLPPVQMVCRRQVAGKTKKNLRSAANFSSNHHLYSPVPPFVF